MESFVAKVDSRQKGNVYRVRRLNVPCSGCEPEPVQEFVTAKYRFGEGEVEGRVVLVQQSQEGEYFF